MKNILLIITAGIFITACGGSKEPKTFMQEFKGMQGTLATKCMTAIKSKAKYPSKVDFAYMSQQSRFFENHFSKSDYPNHPHRYMLSVDVDMMNGFGAMIPHQADCFLNLNTSLDNYKVASIELF